MINHIKDIPQHKAATIAGIGLLIMAILAPIANFSFIQGLITSDDITKTCNNIITFQWKFRIGICMLLFVAILDIVVAWALYVLFKPVNRSLSLLTAWFRLAYAAILGATLVNLTNILQLLGSSDYLKVFDVNQLHYQVMLSIKTFFSGWNIGMVIFGLHLLLLGYLVFKSGFFPKFLGVLLIIAALGYLIDSLGKILLTNYNFSITMFTFIGEVLLIFWLLIKDSKIQESI